MTEDPRLVTAYALCARDGRRHYENFPVGSLLLPPSMRKHVAAVYAFARAADDFADEGQRSAGERQDLLDGWLERLRRTQSGSTPHPRLRQGEPDHTSAIFLALGASIQDCSLPIELLEDLLSAFRQDVTVMRYGAWSDLFDYCRRSANPIGRLVLRISGHRDAQLDAWSDSICTALQLANFWQDFKVDYDRGRLYLPVEEQRLHGAREDDLAAARFTPAWREALSAATVRTRCLFDEGKPLCDAIHGRLRYELRATWLGGNRILDRLVAVRFDVLNCRPTLGLSDGPWFAWQMLTWTNSRVPPAYGSRSL